MKFHLGYPGQGICNLLPIHQILTFKDRHSRKILKRTARNIIFSFRFTNTRIRVKSLIIGFCIFILLSPLQNDYSRFFQRYSVSGLITFTSQQIFTVFFQNDIYRITSMVKQEQEISVFIFAHGRLHSFRRIGCRFYG